VYYQCHGDVPRKHFTTLRLPNGDPVHEELLTSQGFGGPSSILYRRRSAAATLRVAALERPRVEQWDPGVVRNHELDVQLVESKGTLFDSRVPLFFNDDLLYGVCRPTEGGTFCRNALCDELFLVIEGSGTVRSAFGDLAYGPLDLVKVPRGVTFELADLTGDQLLVVMETRSPVGPPVQNVGRSGQLLDRSMYKERDLRVPAFRGGVDEVGEFEVEVKVGDTFTSYVAASHPFDAVGWDGYLYPYAVNLRDLEPLAGRVHPFPDLYQVFGSDGVAVSAIVPVRNPDHPDSTPTQPDHNADCDEIFHRLGSPGDPSPDGRITLHTRAASHGAKPRFKGMEPRERNTGYGIILDVSRPVYLAAAAATADDPEYHRSWV
jgi:homogentisate 1,2-dioxygenase